MKEKDDGHFKGGWEGLPWLLQPAIGNAVFGSPRLFALTGVIQEAFLVHIF